MRARLAGLAIGAAAFVAGCSLLPAPSPAPVDQRAPGGAVIVPPDQMTLNVSNGSKLAVALVVNGVVVDLFEPGGGRFDIAAAELPPLPWSVEIRSPTGRVLVSTTVHAGDVWRADVGGGASEERGAGSRVDLSCGRIDVWSGVPIGGPVPGPGVPGDCAP
jgi:hypothetical protein